MEQRDSFESLSWALDSAPVNLLLIDSENKISLVNSSCLRLFGYEREELLGKNISLLTAEPIAMDSHFPPHFHSHPDFQEMVDAHPMIYGLKKDGTEIPIEIRLQVNQGPELSQAVVVIRDFSHRLESEVKLKDAMKMQKLWAALIENSTDFIGIANEVGEPIYLNPAGRKMVGIPDGIDIRGTKIAEYYTPDQRKMAETVILHEMMQKGHWAGETCFRHWQTEKEIPVSDTHFLIKDKVDGKLIGMGTITRDISERKAKEQAEAANKSKSDYLASVSHEIRTPLGIIIGFAQMIADDAAATSQIKEFGKRIYKSGENLLQLVNDLLDLEKVDAGRIEINSAPVKLHSLMQELMAQFHPMAASRGVRFELQLSKVLPNYILTDELRLRQILINLIGNALKFTPSGVISVTVFTRPSSRGHRLELVANISDSGIGIAPEHRHKIFEPFFSQADKAVKAQYGGTGLGLGLARKFALKMGGDVRLIESALGKGSTFEVSVDAGPALENNTHYRMEAKDIDALRHPEEQLFEDLDKTLIRDFE